MQAWERCGGYLFIDRDGDLLCLNGHTSYVHPPMPISQAQVDVARKEAIGHLGGHEK